ncbi:MAG: hypothetical protein HQL59_02510 [Magnetococcales bacterium]|nr:hypothetical protein [Magnetococcales bacterium]
MNLLARSLVLPRLPLFLGLGVRVVAGPFVPEFPPHPIRHLLVLPEGGLRHCLKLLPGLYPGTIGPEANDHLLRGGDNCRFREGKGLRATGVIDTWRNRFFWRNRVFLR